ncbi:MAG: hypothetical protein ACREGB_03665, partial [Candidatus Saccharimonadales bacterium]
MNGNEQFSMEDNNFAENPNVQYADTVDQVLEDEFAEQAASEEQSFVLSEAIKRIEQAKLYETLLKHQLFAPGSARPEVIDVVSTELKVFILNRLETLLGMKPEPTKTVATQTFSDVQITALKTLADRMVARDGIQPTNPQVVAAGEKSRPAPVTQPSINPVPGSSHHTPNGLGIQVNASAQARQQRPAPVRRGKPRTANTSTFSVGGQPPQDYGQAGPAPGAVRPLPMPSQAAMNAANSAKAGQASIETGGG